MRDKLLQIILLAAGSLALQGAALADDSGNFSTTVAIGAEYTTGSYGTEYDFEDTYVPLSAVVSGDKISLRVTVPYLSVYAPEGTIYDPDGVPLPGTGEMTTESGLGDILASLTVYDVLRSERHRIAVDLTGKVKFGTADEEIGLGTGETDFSVQADAFKFADKTTLIASLGYRVRGEPEGVVLDDSMFAAIGMTYRLTPELRGGLFYDYRQASFADNEDSQEVSAFLSRQLNDGWRIQAYVLAGMSDGSPDFGGGFMVKKALTRRN